MADLPDVSNVDPNAGTFPVLPKGQYIIHFYDSEKKVTNAGDGEYLRLYPEVIQGPRQGEKPSWCDLNLWNPSAQAVEIAQRQLAQICHALNLVGARDSTQFHHKALIAELDIRPSRIGTDGKTYGERNIYRRFLPVNGAATTTAGTAATHAPTGGDGGTAAARPAGTAPWRR